ncbi:MAG: aminopeptidase P family protein [Planctomycetota bacterium]|nr:aminopeptidase P family protein [Planctomycetota bacterium]
MSTLKEVLIRRRKALEAQWGLDTEIVLVPSGTPAPMTGTDQFYEFRVHPEHRYLCGCDTPGQALAFCPDEGWTLFCHVPSANERIWEGTPPDLEAVRDAAGVQKIAARSDLDAWLEKRQGRAIGLLGSRDLKVADDEALTARLAESVTRARLVKDVYEQGRMRAAAAATREGHLAAFRGARAGMTELELRMEIETAFVRAGGDRAAFSTIVASGRNSSVLHWMPTRRELRSGEIVLVDAGAEVDGYAGDVTRVLPVSGTFTQEQRDLYEVVLAANEKAIATAGPGVEYIDVHMAAAGEIARGLVDFGLLRGDARALVERDAHALFFPHGIGHLLGLATHDVGGKILGRKPSKRFGLDKLRTDLPLQPGYVVTIEPGLYFIKAILTNARWREKFSEEIDWARADRLRDFGGIRIEDNVLVTDEGREVLTAGVPKSVEEVEGLRREADS